LADCYAVYSGYDVLPPREAAPKAKEAASKALALDDTLAEPHAAVAMVKSHYDWNWSGAESEFKRAIQLDPSYATAHEWYAQALEAMGRLDEAITEAKRAQEADPLSLAASAVAGHSFYIARRYDQAIEQLGKTLAMDPNFVLAHRYLARVYEKVARYEEAIAECQRALSFSGGEPYDISALGRAYAVSGKRAEAQKALAELKDLSRRRYVAPFYIGLVYVGLGDKNQALEWLNKAYEDRSTPLMWINVDPRLDGIRGDPRYHALLRRMHLEP
jgi:tetratricopeptide (TPR) repeat protein